MKKQLHKKGRKSSEAHPLEFERGWQELEARNDRLKPDWMSLAAQLGISKSRAY